MRYQERSYIQESSAHFFKNGGKPSGIITVPGSLDAEKAKEIKAAWDAGYTGENAGKTGLLSGGTAYQALTMSAVDADTVEQQKLSDLAICSAFHVPAYKAGVGEINEVLRAEFRQTARKHLCPGCFGGHTNEER